MGVQPVLQIACPNRVGLVNAITGLVLKRQGDIAEIDQHIDPETHAFFMRMSWNESGPLSAENFLAEVQSIIGKTQAQTRLILNNTPKKMAILVSQYDHCLVDLLWRIKNRELNVIVPLIISNHPHHQKLAELFGIPYHILPVDKNSQPQQEQKIAQLLKSHAVDFVVLARYMRILGSSLIHEYEQRIINIHHSFLPAFAGANPYQQAHERGVKIIGATAHFATEVLDDGPIIAQDTVPISHEHGLEDLKRMGRDIEKRVLSKAVKLYTEDRIFVSNKRTVIFE